MVYTGVLVVGKEEEPLLLLLLFPVELMLLTEADQPLTCFDVL